MVEVNERTNAITITQGDSGDVSIRIIDSDGQDYVPVEGDTVRFAVKKYYTDSEPLLVINVPIDTMILHFNPQDTKNLEAGPAKGRYKYDMELTRTGGLVDTFIPRADFIVLEEVM